MATDPTGRISHIPEMHRGFSWKPACRVATTATVTISTALNNGDTIDGVTLVTGDRVLVKNQSTASQNGIYIVGATPTRAADMDQDGTTAVPAEEIAGAVVFVISGTANASTLWYTTNAVGGTIGSTSISWTQFTGGGASFATPAIALGSSAGAGAAATVIRSDATIAAFDATNPTTQALGDSAVVGTAAFAARRDHKHAMPTAAVTTSGLTMATAKVLGRSTAATGAIEELTVGTGLTLAGGTLSAPGGGTGGTSTYPLDTYAIDGTYGDHFTGGSLSGIWTRRNFTGGAETYQLGKNSTYMRIAMTGRTNGDAYFQTAPAGDWTFAMAFIPRFWTSFAWSLAVVNTLGTGLAATYANVGSGDAAIANLGLTTYTTYSGVFSNGGTSVGSQGTSYSEHKIWIYLRKSGTSYFCAHSRDGEEWSPESTAFTSAITVDRVGMLVHPQQGIVTAALIDIDWFNKIA